MYKILVYTKRYTDDDVWEGAIDPAIEANESVNSFDPQFDVDGHVEWAVEFLNREGLTEPSSSPDFWEGIWYSPVDERIIDHYRGIKEEASAHLGGFTDAEKREIWEKVVPENQRR